jgi:2'-5' RNA ligase
MAEGISMSNTWRLFIAAELPDDVLHALGDVLRDLTQTIPDKAIRSVRPEGIHLTLKFLGDVPINKVDALKPSLHEITTKHTIFELIANGAGCFPNTRRPRVVWVGVDGNIQALKRLQRDVEQVCTQHGFEPEDRPFNPHLTLARTQRKVTSDDIRRIGHTVETAQIDEIARWQVSSFSLIRSELKPGGAVYTTLEEFSLG